MSRYRPFSPVTAVVRAGILAALAEGAATVAEIEARMGIKPTTATWRHLRVLERKGEVVLIDRVPSTKHAGGVPLTVWALPAQNEERARA